jgi:hypothetical protein
LEQFVGDPTVLLEGEVMVPNYYNPYQYQAQAQSQPGINWVQGEAGAKSFLVGAGQSVMLMDSEESVFYIKSTDQSGMPQPLRVFDYKERTQSQKSDGFVTREEFDKLCAVVKAMTEKEANESSV